MQANSSLKKKQQYFSTFDPRYFSSQIRVTSAPMTDELRRWIAENKFAGSDDRLLVQELINHGISPSAAKHEVAIVRQNPYFQSGQKFVQLLKKHESHANILAELATLSPRSRTIERRETICRHDFLENYYAKNMPLILTGITHNWSALNRWNPEYLKTNYGQIEIEVQSDRCCDRLYEINIEKHRKKMQMADYVDAVVKNGATNDYYMVANNGNLEKTELRGLLDDLEIFPEYLDPLNTDGKAFFWFGSGGTITPLHHDPVNLIFVQVYGHKVWKIIPPYYTHLLYNYRGVFSEVDIENPDYQKYPLFQKVPIIEVTLEPGDAIFMPVGWWHAVKSLDISISMSFTNFQFPNKYEWNFPSIT
ncbi:cupin-like domain-containing protein [Pseudanabaena mucicola]|uniref:Cupin-like domain-containing protein n=1 Tax=Pseudanabaena mucicola FACHB-723 TaxID=2692860 RepID=A0ABR7ZYC2_9CYAN|nr:cupin-like domain-containing protein [Pseudanabaena mucicola]MBD2188948.1 cupin-like domain-containing protein [Pseudanabaena mucicola FACHB-723]